MIFYRYYLRPGEFGYPDPTIVERRFVLVRETPKGYWIDDERVFQASQADRWGLNQLVMADPWDSLLKPKWVSKTSRKRFAYPAKEEALNSLLIRLRKRVEYANAELSKCRPGIDIVQKMLRND